MAGAGPFAAALTALQGCYAEAAPLETFIQRLRESGAGEAEVLQADDAPCYRTFVAQCVVCVPRGARSIPRPFTFQQLSSQSEVITRVIQRLCEKRKKNVLAYGYSLLDENSSHFRIMPSSNICSYLPNTATETLRISGLWETLLSRIGDDVMMYLLEHCAIFMLVPPSSCYQVCGQPIYELISNNVESSPLFVKQRYSKHRRNALFDYMQKRLMFHKKHLSKSHWWKCKRRPEAQVSSRGNQKTNKMQCLVSGLMKPMEGISSKYRRLESPLDHLGKKLPNTVLHSGVYIERKSLLYSRWSFKECFPKWFLLNRLKGCQASGRRLVETIFLSQNLLEQKRNQSLPHHNWRKKRLPKRYWQMRNIFQKLVKNHGKCPYSFLLKKNCPIGISEANVGKKGGRADVELLKQHSSHWQVYVFVRQCLERVIPAELWGSNHNKCRFLKNVRAFISMGKFDKLSLRELMWKMRVNDCVWLRLVKGDHFVPAYEHCFREELLAKFLYWLMDTYVVELLRSFFYITETMFQKNMLFYYRKLIWGKLQNIGIRNHFAKVHLRALSSEEFEAIHQKKNVPMASRLRFIPKPNGLRPIVKVSSVVEARAFSKESREKKVHHYNTQLKNLFSVLNYERTINTSFLGSSVFGKDDIFKIWKKFVTKVLQSDGEIPHFYYVKVCLHPSMFKLIPQLSGTEFSVAFVIYFFILIQVSTFNDFMPDMKQFVSQLQESDSLQNAIVVEQSLSFNETSSSLFTFFLQMLHNNILEIGRRYYLQCCGIPQGSILSTLLCSLCYGDMENKLLCGIQQDGVLIRLIDDFLLVTPHLTQARTFLRTLATGIPEYGFLINPNKTVVNFPVDDIPGCSKFKQLPDCRLIPWCGLLLDIQTLEVYCDYSSYTGTSIRSSLSFNSSRTAGKNMKYKLITVLKLKCHCLFLDLQINSLRTVFINIYKIFLLQAYRFHACVLQLPFNQQVRNNPYFFLRIISETASCCYSILKAKNAGIPLGNKGATGVFPSEAAEWLCYHAFTVKLANHKVVYKCLLKPLKICKMQLFRKIPKDTMALLKTVTEPSLCQDFKAILD
uniref:Telomerase reverse transcriptase n=1 Tax=Dromaius novaehollandiae TaxID=8790 RepID=A0A8C4K6A7_DRONO